MKRIAIIIAALLSSTVAGAPALAAVGGLGACSGSNAMSNAMTAAGVAVSLYTGGRANAALQVAQQIQLVAQRICQTESLMAQLQMLAGMDIRTFDDVLAVLNRLDPLVAQFGIDLPDLDLMKMLESAYPEAFPPGTRYEDMQQQQIIWDDRARSALDTTAKIQNNVIQQQQVAIGRAGRIEQAGRDSGGLRGAQLATNALLTELMGSMNNLITVNTAHQRALTEVQYRQEAERAAAERDNADFMAKLGECPKCGQHSINLFGDAGNRAVRVGGGARTANQVFGTGN